MPADRCRYCEQIRLADPRYRMKPAKHDLGSSFPRCDAHWRFVCDTCGRSHHFNGMAWCPTARKFLCIKCAPRHRAVRKGFWRWAYYYALACPTCGRELAWIPAYARWYCYAEAKYAPKDFGRTDAPLAKEPESTPTVSVEAPATESHEGHYHCPS